MGLLFPFNAICSYGDCTTEYTGLSSHPMRSPRKCSPIRSSPVGRVSLTPPTMLDNCPAQIVEPSAITTSLRGRRPWQSPARLCAFVPRTRRSPRPCRARDDMVVGGCRFCLYAMQSSNRLGVGNAARPTVLIRPLPSSGRDGLPSSLLPPAAHSR